MPGAGARCCASPRLSGLKPSTARFGLIATSLSCRTAAPRDGHADRQPVFLTLDDANPNGAAVLFLLEAAEEREPERFSRVIRLFDGADEEAKALARTEWKRAKAAASR